jgi:hypothetical protein
MSETLLTPSKYEALFKKYSSRRYMKAAIFVKDFMEKTMAAQIADKESDDEEEDNEEQEENEGEEEI